MKVLGIDATYYWAKDLARATEFYTWLIGSPPTMAMLNVFSEWTFPNGESFGLYKGEEFVRSDGVMFAVEDVKATLEEIKAKGHKVQMDGHVEETPVCFMGFAEDSEGNGFLLHHRKSGEAGAVA
jgi:predicted enzyme related to lactoylglutathione lyase